MLIFRGIWTMMKQKTLKIPGPESMSATELKSVVKESVPKRLAKMSKLMFWLQRLSSNRSISSAQIFMEIFLVALFHVDVKMPEKERKNCQNFLCELVNTKMQSSVNLNTVWKNEKFTAMQIFSVKSIYSKVL